MKEKSLLKERCIASTHLDYDYCKSVSFGFDEKFRFVVMMESEYVYFPCYDNRVMAVMESDEAFNVAKRMNVRMSELSSKIAEYYDYDEYDEGEIDVAFEDVLNLLLEHGAHFRIVREGYPF